MKIAAVSATEAGLTDDVLHDLAIALLGRGIAVAGAVQSTVQANGDRNKVMELVLLPDRTRRQISVNAAPGTPGCSLDPGALEEAVSDAEARIQAGCDLAILNKFGQREAEGRGFRTAIAAAVEKDIPLLIGVAPERLAAFEAFLGASAKYVPAEMAPLEAWIRKNAT